MAKQQILQAIVLKLFWKCKSLIEIPALSGQAISTWAAGVGMNIHSTHLLPLNFSLNKTATLRLLRSVPGQMTWSAPTQLGWFASMRHQYSLLTSRHLRTCSVWQATQYATCRLPTPQHSSVHAFLTSRLKRRARRVQWRSFRARMTGCAWLMQTRAQCARARSRPVRCRRWTPTSRPTWCRFGQAKIQLVWWKPI